MPPLTHIVQGRSVGANVALRCPQRRRRGAVVRDRKAERVANRAGTTLSEAKSKTARASLGPLSLAAMGCTMLLVCLPPSLGSGLWKASTGPTHARKPAQVAEHRTGFWVVEPHPDGPYVLFSVDGRSEYAVQTQLTYPAQVNLALGRHMREHVQQIFPSKCAVSSDQPGHPRWVCASSLAPGDYCQTLLHRSTFMVLTTSANTLSILSKHVLMDLGHSQWVTEVDPAIKRLQAMYSARPFEFWGRHFSSLHHRGDGIVIDLTRVQDFVSNALVGTAESLGVNPPADDATGWFLRIRPDLPNQPVSAPLLHADANDAGLQPPRGQADRGTQRDKTPRDAVNFWTTGSTKDRQANLPLAVEIRLKAELPGLRALGFSCSESEQAINCRRGSDLLTYYKPTVANGHSSIEVLAIHDPQEGTFLALCQLALTVIGRAHWKANLEPGVARLRRMWSTRSQAECNRLGIGCSKDLVHASSSASLCLVVMDMQRLTFLTKTRAAAANLPLPEFPPPDVVVWFFAAGATSEK